MRVISGIARGHKLKAPRGQLTRPTLDRVREAIFNVVAAKIPGSTVLDLFSGSGAMGIEALSRGADWCVFNDYDKKSCQIIKANLLHTKLAKNSEVYNFEARQLIAFLAEKNNKKLFDLIFLDPPYESGLYEEVFTKLVHHNLLNKGALIIAESDNNLELKPYYDKIRLNKTRRYGDTLVWYYEYMEE